MKPLEKESCSVCKKPFRGCEPLSDGNGNLFHRKCVPKLDHEALKIQVTRSFGELSRPKTFVLTDYWNERRDHRPYRNHLHDPKTDELISDQNVLETLINEAGAVDGDEIEIVVRKTGRRPFGNRKVRLVEPHTYKRERRPS